MPAGVGADDCTFFGLHTILFDLGGVEVEFGVTSLCFHTFLGGVGTTFGVSSFVLGYSFSTLVSFYFLYFS